MKKIKINGVEEELITETMHNGLRIFLLPNNRVKNYYMTFSTKFGSVTTEFKKETSKNYIKIPNGVAHFLEHLTFNLEGNVDATDLFADLGSSSNAFTGFNVTCYEVFGYDKFKENLETLLDFVQSPYYTSELVDNEKGIICEEVKMYEDDPQVNLTFSLLKNMLHSHNAKNLVAGTVKDVKSTKLSDIEAAYNMFYHPSNMFVIITGNFNPEEALAIISENQLKKKFSKSFKIKTPKHKEDISIVKDYEEITGNVEIPKVNIGLKIPLSAFKTLKLTPLELRIYINIITNSMFGRSSKIKDRLVRGNIITDGLYVNRTYLDDYILVSIMAETPYPSRYISLMKEEIKKITIEDDELNRKKRVAISNFIRSFDDIEEVNLSIQSDILNYGEVVTNLYDIYNELNITDCLKVASKINSKNMSIVVLKNKEK